MCLTCPVHGFLDCRRDEAEHIRLPGFTRLNWPSFAPGLVETFAYGWYVALIFAPLFNVFSARLG
jgi:hypothetical protein